MRRILTLALVAATALSGCMSKGSDVIARINTRSENIVAMVGQEHRTDQSLISYFKHVDTLVIRSGAGGELDGMMQTLAYLDQHPEKTVIIDGECASACTLLLSRPNNVVFTERASFLFHSAYVGECKRGLRHYNMAQIGNDRMMNVFPDEFKGWLIGKNAFGSVNFTRLHALVAKYYFPNMMVRHEDLPKGMLDVVFPIVDSPIETRAALVSCK